MITNEQILDSIGIIREARANDKRLNSAFKKFDDINEVFSMSGLHEQWIVDKIDTDIKACTGFIGVYSMFVYDWQFLDEGSITIETEDSIYFIEGVDSFVKFVEEAKASWDGVHVYNVNPTNGTVVESLEYIED